MFELREHHNQHDADNNRQTDADVQEQHVRVVFLLGKTFAGGVESRRARAFRKFVQVHAARDDHRGIHLSRRGWGCWRRGRDAGFRPWDGRGGGNRRAFRHQLQFDLAEPQRLPGLQDGFGNLLVVDEGTVGGIQVANEHIGTLQEDFTMMARDGGVGDLKGVVLHTTNGGFVHIQLVGAPVHSRAEDDKFRHRLLHAKVIISTARLKSNGNIWPTDTSVDFKARSGGAAESLRASWFTV